MKEKDEKLILFHYRKVSYLLQGVSLFSNAKPNTVSSGYSKIGVDCFFYIFLDDLSFFPENTNTIHPIYSSEKNNRSEDDLQNYWQFKT